MLTETALRIALTRSYRNSLRIYIWEKRRAPVSYIVNPGNLPKEIRDIIEMDVNRCFHNNPHISRQNLINILQAFAL
jgi:hypothetical protein